LIDKITDAFAFGSARCSAGVLLNLTWKRLDGTFMFRTKNIDIPASMPLKLRKVK
jgi:hypothetical protein